MRGSWPVTSEPLVHELTDSLICALVTTVPLSPDVKQLFVPDLCWTQRALRDSFSAGEL